MSGFSGILLKSEQYQPLAACFEFPDRINKYYEQKKKIVKGCLSVALYDNANSVSSSRLESNAEGISGLAGVVFNPELLQRIDNKHPEEGLGTIKGGYSAMGYDEHQEYFWLATDPTGSRQIFYFDHPCFLLFSSSIFLLRDMMRHFGLSYKLSESAAYMMLSLGYLLDDYTLIVEIKKLPAGHVLHMTDQKTIKKRYHNYYEEIRHSRITKSLLSELDELYQESVQMEYKQDTVGGKLHVAMLSGGLDSRLNVMLAHKQGFTDFTCLTFSQNLSDDELTARKICKDLSLRHNVFLHNGGSHLYDIDTALVLNNCSVYYFGATQTLASLRQMDSGNWGLIHHGNLAESSKGGYLSGRNHSNPCIEKRYAVSDRLFEKIPKEILHDIYALYPNNEMFVTYSRGFNATHNGNWMSLPFAHSIYTYMDQDFASLAYSIHPKLRHNGYLTVEWIRQLHPELAEYPWQLGIRPTNNSNRIFAAKLYNKLFRQFVKANNTYVPFEWWFKHNEQLRRFIQSTYHDIDDFKDLGSESLYRDTLHLYDHGGVVEKLLCISFIRSLRMLFG